MFSRWKMDSALALRTSAAARLKELNQRANSRFSGDEEGRYERERDAAMLRWREDEPGKNDEEEVVYVYISSAARDLVAWPSPSQYQVSLTAEVDNLIEASVVQASFPLTFPTIESTSNSLVFTLSSSATVYTVAVPPGAYTGEALALELMAQMNQVLFAAFIPVPYHMDFTTGYLRNIANVLAPGQDQIRVAWDDTRLMMRFQLVDDAELPQSSPTLTLRVLKAGGDIFPLLGFRASLVAAEGTLVGAYYQLNNAGGTSFSTAASVDTRYAYSIYSVDAVDLSGPCALVLDIPQLNDNDLAFVVSSNPADFNIGACFGLVYTKQPAYLSDRILEFNNSTYPIKKVYRSGRGRTNTLNINIRRINGVLVDFRGADHCMTLKLVVKRTQPMKPVFTR